MRVVFTCAPAYGHLHPLLPLAQAFVDGGDDVVIATAPEMIARAEAAGFATAAVGADMGVWWQELTRRAGGQPGDGLPIDRILPYFIPRLFAEIGAQQMTGDLVPCVRDADLVVFETYAFAGALAAAVTGVKAVHHLLGPPPPLETMTLAGDSISPLWRAWKLDPRSYAGMYSVPTLNVSPPSLVAGDIPDGAELLQLRPVPMDAAGGEGLPAWFDELPDRPIVYMTLGTETNTDRTVFGAVFDGLAHLSLNLIVTVGRQSDPAMLESIPDNARVERYIPQSLLLPRCAAVISHGGSGTMLATISHGLPHLMIPQGADQYVNAELCTRAGIAERLLPDEVSATVIGTWARQTLGRGEQRAEIARAQAEVQSMPLPADVASSLRRRLPHVVPA